MNWKHRVKFRDLLEDYDESKDELEEIKRVKPLWETRFKQYPCLHSFLEPLKKVKTEAQFNRWLNTVYDYCDYNAIWVEIASDVQVTSL